jgi:hypothetical protein
MALRQQSLFVYGLEINALNSSLDFKAVFGGPEIRATLNVGFYSLTSLAEEIVRALTAADTSQTYAASVNRNVSGGLENRMSIASSSYLELLFLTGSRAASSIAPLIGFLIQDYVGGAAYQGSSSAGKTLLTTYPGYTYSATDWNQQVQGARSISASGVKEAVVFQIQEFFDIEFKHELLDKVINEWKPFMQWAIQQRDFEFTPNYSEYATVIECTLEKTGKDGSGLGFQFKEELPGMPGHFSTGTMTFRKRVVAGEFII